MSNLANVVGAVIGLAAINKLLDRDDTTMPTTPKPLIPEGFTIGPAGPDMDIAPLFPTGKLELTTRIPGGAATSTGPLIPLGSDFVAPDFSKVETAISKLNFVKPDISKLPKPMPRPLEFTTGYFTDPAVQARLRAKQ